MQQFIREEDGQDVAEYGLLVAAVGLVILASTSSLGRHVHDWLAIIAARVWGTVS